MSRREKKRHKGELPPDRGLPAGARVPFWHSIRSKYALTYLVVIAAVICLLNTYPLLMAQNMVFKSKETALKSQTAAVASALAVSEELTAEGAEQAMLLLEDLSATRILVTNEAGLVLYDSSTREDNLYRYAMLGEIVTALRGNDVFRSEYRDRAFRSRAAVPIVYRGQTIGAVYLYESDAEQAQLLEEIQGNLRYISAVICVAAVVLCVVFSRALTRNVDNLLAAFRQVREGEYSYRVRLRGKDELAMLAGEFNELTGRLQTTEEVRRRFVSDASHELKTPLASIRLLTDSILQSENIDMDTVREFVSDIGEEADRLTRISEKLLTLTRLDARTTVETQRVDVAHVIQRVEHMLFPLARAGEVRLTCHLEEGCAVLATGDDLYQVVFNLVENAIKYNLPGGFVDVKLCKSGDTVILQVCDSGVGIPEDEMDKIFDRFYRVDKARSRAAGGTGLGLSIVRQTARQHGGEVTVARREGGSGTVFTVTFPAFSGEGDAQ